MVQSRVPKAGHTFTFHFDDGREPQRYRVTAYEAGTGWDFLILAYRVKRVSDIDGELDGLNFSLIQYPDPLDEGWKRVEERLASLHPGVRMSVAGALLPEQDWLEKMGVTSP